MNQQTATFAPIKHLSLTNPRVNVNLRSERGELIVELKSHTLALLVELSLEGTDTVFSDNYVNLPAGRTKQLSCPMPAEWTLNQAQKAFRLRSVYNSYSHGDDV